MRAHRRKTLTPLGIAAAIVVSSLYSIHPWGVFLLILLIFYVTSTSLTKVFSGTTTPANILSINMILNNGWSLLLLIKM